MQRHGCSFNFRLRFNMSISLARNGFLRGTRIGRKYASIGLLVDCSLSAVMNRLIDRYRNRFCANDSADLLVQHYEKWLISKLTLRQAPCWELVWA